MMICIPVGKFFSYSVRRFCGKGSDLVVVCRELSTNGSLTMSIMAYIGGLQPKQHSKLHHSRTEQQRLRYLILF